MVKRLTPSATPSRNYLRDWRKHRKMTLDKIAAEVGTSKGHLSNIENYKSALTQELAEMIAAVLNTDAISLRSRPPTDDVDDEMALVGLFRQASSEQRKVMLDMGRSITSLGKRPN